jgi:exopolysaccharide biosynthesis polyprenyl glycosylphosphotransferase
MARVVRPSERAFLLIIADAASACGAVVLALWTWTFTAGFAFSPAFMFGHALWFLTVPVWVVALAPTRHASVALDLRDILVGIVRAGALLFVVYLVVFFYAGRAALPRLVAVYVLWNCAGLTVAGRLVLLWTLTRDQFTRRFIVVGDATAVPTAVALFERPALRDAQLLGVVMHGDDRVALPVTLLGPLADIDQIAVRLDATDVMVALDRDVEDDLVARLLRCQEAGIDVVGMAQLYEQVLRRVPVRHLAPAWLLTHLFGAAGPRDTSPLAKRLLDMAVALILTVVGVVVGAVVACAIVIDSGRPVFYSQVRVGRAGRRFRLVKFRTMRRDAEANGPQWSPEGDPRITRVGRVLRRTHLDELPNLWAVLRGDLSMVGPRPERDEFVSMLEREVPLYRARLTVTPGLTGWAQVNHEYGDSVDDAAAKLEYDLYYVRHRSVWFDLEILANTVGRMLGWRGR